MKERKKKKKQWGTETNLKPLSWIHEKPTTFKLAISKIAIYSTVIIWILYILSTIIRQFINGPQDFTFTMEAIGYSIIVTLLTFSAFVYLLSRHGALVRFSKHERVPRAILDKYFSEHKSKITVLVPSYDEEPKVIRKTLLSAILQEYPEMRVVLLIDDNPNTTDLAKLEKLNRTYAVIDEIQNLISKPYKRFQTVLDEFERRENKSNIPSIKSVRILIKNFQWASNWFFDLADNEEIEDHVDVFFAEEVLRGLGNDLLLIADALQMSLDTGAILTKERVRQLHLQLVWIFQGEVTHFERKRYASLSHEANKAMNLNSYIGLMGGTYRESKTKDGVYLLPVDEYKPGDYAIPDSDFLLTLDADSILLRDYCLRLIYFLEQPGHERYAVVQTPYSSFRGATSRIERISGATTDIQHILHQGMTYYGATFWVGANAIIRKIALEDIVEKEIVGGFEIKRYIQDRTVIEDTESSVDLVIKGWKLMNYPERLSYSATPPDFGSLIIQRRRWANGGLLMLNKLWESIRYRKQKNQTVPWAEVIHRLNYMASIAWSSFGLIWLLIFPFDGNLLSPLVLLAALPYFISMAYDLKYNGYNYLDIFGIYGFNLILLPVNLAGVLKSIEQGITGKKIPFARTPKVNNRTASSLEFLLIPIGIVLFSLYIFALNISNRNWGNAIFAAFNALTATWAILAYIGIDTLIVDIWHGITNWLFIEVTPRVKTTTIETEQSTLDWQTVLYSGEKNGEIPYTSLNNLVVEENKVKKRNI